MQRALRRGGSSCLSLCLGFGICSLLGVFLPAFQNSRGKGAMIGHPGPCCRTSTGRSAPAQGSTAGCSLCTTCGGRHHAAALGSDSLCQTLINDIRSTAVFGPMKCKVGSSWLLSQRSEALVLGLGTVRTNAAGMPRPQAEWGRGLRTSWTGPEPPAGLRGGRRGKLTSEQLSRHQVSGDVSSQYSPSSISSPLSLLSICSYSFDCSTNGSTPSLFTTTLADAMSAAIGCATCDIQ